MFECQCCVRMLKAHIRSYIALDSVISNEIITFEDRITGIVIEYKQSKHCLFVCLFVLDIELFCPQDSSETIFFHPVLRKFFFFESKFNLDKIAPSNCPLAYCFDRFFLHNQIDSILRFSKLGFFSIPNCFVTSILINQSDYFRFWFFLVRAKKKKKRKPASQSTMSVVMLIMIINVTHLLVALSFLYL